MHSILVTGGAGFIGSCFVRYLLERDPGVRLVTLDALTYAGSLENLRDLQDPARHTFVHGDICDRELVLGLLRQHDIDTVVHFAAESHVDRSILGPAPFINTNVLGTFSVVEAARISWLVERTADGKPTRFLHISTDEVYGSLGPEDAPFSETTPYSPNSPYAASKAASDHLVRAYAHTYGLPAVITNCSNNYGPYQFPEKLIPLVILNAMEGNPLPVYGDGRYVRDWLFVEDHCEALDLVLRRGRIDQTYNIGGSNQPMNLEVVELLCAIMDEARPDSPWVPHRSLIQFVPDRPGHDRRYGMDTTKIHDELGWRPRHTLAEGLRKTVTWYLSHPEWIAAIRNKPDYQAWLEANYAARGEASLG